MAKQPEGKLARKIRTHLLKRGAFVANIHGGDNPFQEVGLPDMLACFLGQFIGLEVKLPGEEPSPKQRVVLSRIAAAGGIALPVYSVEEVEAVLRRIERKGG